LNYILENCVINKEIEKFITIYCGSIWDLLNAYKYDIYEEEKPYSWYSTNGLSVMFECKTKYVRRFIYLEDQEKYFYFINEYNDKLYNVKLFFYKIHDNNRYLKKNNFDNLYYSLDSVIKSLNNDELIENFKLYSKLKRYLLTGYKIIYLYIYNIIHVTNDLDFN
jgi:hypothetical protein